MLICAPNTRIGAERGDRKIAVEVKSFLGPSIMTDLAQALGQYLIYKSWLARIDADRPVYLAIDSETATDIFSDIAVQVLIEDYGIRLVVVDVINRRILSWTSERAIAPS